MSMEIRNGTSSAPVHLPPVIHVLCLLIHLYVSTLLMVCSILIVELGQALILTGGPGVILLSIHLAPRSRSFGTNQSGQTTSLAASNRSHTSPVDKIRWGEECRQWREGDPFFIRLVVVVSMKTAEDFSTANTSVSHGGYNHTLDQESLRSLCNDMSKWMSINKT